MVKKKHKCTLKEKNRGALRLPAVHSKQNAELQFQPNPLASGSQRQLLTAAAVCLCRRRRPLTSGEAAKIKSDGEAAKIKGDGEAAKIQGDGEAPKIKGAGEAAKIKAGGSSGIEPSRKQSGVLVLGAKWQLVSLHHFAQPAAFTARQLAQQFPISEQACAHLLKSLSLRRLAELRSNARLVAEHDAAIVQRWSRLRRRMLRGHRFPPGYRWLARLGSDYNDKLLPELLQNACGVPHLPHYVPASDGCLAELHKLVEACRQAQEAKRQAALDKELVANL